MSQGVIEIDPQREQRELEDYLGERFKIDSLRNYQDTLDREVDEIGDEQRLYRKSRAYLYNLTAFAMTGTKTPYLRELVSHLEPGARLLDYGCGIGSDGLLLLEAGFRVEFADFDNPSVEYLRWRLARRGLEAPIYDLERGVASGFDAAYAFDVIEHVDDPVGFLEEMERRASLVMVNLLKPEPGDQDLHHELPVKKLVDRAAERHLISYRILHGRSHLIFYRPQMAPIARRLKQLATVRVRRARAPR